MKTNAEIKRDKYSDVMDIINDTLDDIDNLDELISQIDGVYSTMENNPDSAQGRLNTTYVTTEGSNKETFRRIAGAMEEFKSSLGARLRWATRSYNQWDAQVKKEEQEKKNK